MKVETSIPTDVRRPIGPYSHVAKAGLFIAISGTAGVDPVTGELAGPAVVAEPGDTSPSDRAQNP